VWNLAAYSFEYFTPLYLFFTTSLPRIKPFDYS
jgi:hypothetical protein